MDPNVLACPEWRDILGQLAESGAHVDINQGLDIRMMTDEKCEALARIRLSKVHFAWDRDEDLEPLFRRWSPHIRVNPRKRMVYCLVNYGTSTEFDLHRIYTLRDMGYEPFVMVYDKSNAPDEKKNIARWCNDKAIFHTVKKFEEYRN